MTNRSSDEQEVRDHGPGDRLAALIRGQIVCGSLSPGDRLPSEQELAERYEISDEDAWAALSRLESEGLLRRPVAGGPASVQEVDPRAVVQHFSLLLQHRAVSLADVYESRVDLETGAVARLARTRSEEDLAQLQHAVEASEAAQSDPEAYAAHEAAFSELIVKLSGNAAVEIIAEMLYGVIGVHYASFGLAHSDAAGRRAARAAQRAHVRLVELVRARDVEPAQRLWQRHLDEVTQYVQDDLSKLVVEVLG